MKQYNLKPLTFNANDLEPAISQKTIEVHYYKHHQNYLNLTNECFKDFNLDLDLESLLKNPELIPEKVRTKLINNGGGYYNHTLYWKVLKKYTKENAPTGKILELINKSFHSYDNFKSLFKETAKTLFGSGWATLVYNKEDNLEIVKTQNQNTALNVGKPILTIDVWEHAYYLDWQNRRIDYIDEFFNIIDWKAVEELLSLSSIIAE